MNLDQYNAGFAKLQALRMERLSPRYTVETPEGPRNLAYKRDAIFDILEEAADSVNILQLLIGRISDDKELVAAMERDPNLGMALFGNVNQIINAFEHLLGAAWALDSELDPKYRQETVERVVSRQEAGLDV